MSLSSDLADQPMWAHLFERHGYTPERPNVSSPHILHRQLHLLTCDHDHDHFTPAPDRAVPRP